MPLAAIIDTYCERYGLSHWDVEAALLDPVKADHFWRAVDLWTLEARYYRPKKKP